MFYYILKREKSMVDHTFSRSSGTHAKKFAHFDLFWNEGQHLVLERMSKKKNTAMYSRMSPKSANETTKFPHLPNDIEAA